jgi:hypothetical protein
MFFSDGKLYIAIASLLDYCAYPANDFATLYYSHCTQGYKAHWRSSVPNFLLITCIRWQLGHKTIKEDYKINRTYAFSHLKRCLPRWLLVTLPSAAQFMTTLAERVKNLIGSFQGCQSHAQSTLKPTVNILINLRVKHGNWLKFIRTGTIPTLT